MMKIKVDNFELRVLINCREEDLDHFEKFYIDFNKQQGFKCYNVSSGGQGSERTTDVGERLQTKLKSYKNLLRDSLQINLNLVKLQVVRSYLKRLM